MKTILVLGAGYYLGHTLSLLREHGYRVVALDRDPHAPARHIANAFHPVDIIDREKVLTVATKEAVDGIMAVNDFGVRTAAYVSNRLALPGISPKTAETASDKGTMRDCWAAAALDQPQYCVVATQEEAREAVRNIGLPCVMKPTDCGGSGRGISIIRTHDDVEWAYRFAEPFVNNDRFIVEEFLDGAEMTIEAFSIDGDVHILAISDKEKPAMRTCVALSLNYPAKGSRAQLDAVKRLATEAVQAIGIKDGISHTEVIMTETGPQLVELGARGGGGHVFHTCIESVSGLSGPLLQAAMLTGQAVNIENIEQNGCVYRFFNPEHGILVRVDYQAEAKTLPGVVDFGIFKHPGDEVGVLPNSLHRAGFVVTCGRDRAEAIARADHVEKTIRFVVNPLGEQSRRKYAF